LVNLIRNANLIDD